MAETTLLGRFRLLGHVKTKRVLSLLVMPKTVPSEYESNTRVTNLARISPLLVSDSDDSFHALSLHAKGPFATSLNLVASAKRFQSESWVSWLVSVAVPAHFRRCR